MKIRQAKKIVKKYDLMFDRPSRMTAKVIEACICIGRWQGRYRRKRTRGFEACLVRSGPVKIWVDGVVLGYATSITLKLP